MTRVDFLVIRMLKTTFGWAFNPCIDGYINYTKNIKQMYYDHDTWESDGSDMDDIQLFKLGLDVEKINDKKDYWEYNVRTGRHYGGEGGRSRITPPSW